MSGTLQVEPHRPLAITLAAAQWATILELLDTQGVHRVVRPLIDDIQAQIRLHLTAPPPAPEPPAAVDELEIPKPNGAASHA